MTKGISEEFTYQSHYIDILGSKIHYIDEGQGSPILFLHGIPASSYVWRNIIPHLTPLGRCIAPDLIGMGKSEKPDIQYTIRDHIRYIDAFIEALHLKNLIIVMHGWGSLIGADYAMRHEKNCKGLVFYESFLKIFDPKDFSLALEEQLHIFESREHSGELEVHEGIYYIDKILPQEIMRPLTKKEINYYRQPFKEHNSGKAVLQYLKELPCIKRNDDVTKIISNYSKKLMSSKVPKLLLYSVPGFVTTIETAMWAKKHFPNLEIVDVGEELHYAQESNPVLMGEGISIWLQGIEARK